MLVLILFAVLAAPATAATRSSKKGLVIPNWPRHHCYDFQRFTTVSWWYNYFPIPDPVDYSPWWCTWVAGARPEGEDRQHCFPDDPAAVEFIPQVYGVPGLGHHANTSFPPVPDQYKTLLGFNEPNHADQADIEPAIAAAAWIELQERYPDKTLVAPATGNADTEWFDQFWTECQVLGCRFDYLATHHYTSSPDKTMQILKDYSDRYGGLKIWFTEFAVAREHDETAIRHFARDLLPQLEHAPFIHRYSWFYTRYYENYDDSGWFWIDPINSLLEQNSTHLTHLGQVYNQPWHEEQYKPTGKSWQQ